MLVIGLTGSIGMGKSATAGLFRACGVPVHDSDAQVHALYGGEAVEPVRALFPQAVGPQGVDRAVLRDLALHDPAVLKALERIVHPLVREARRGFVRTQAARGARIAVCDIPLLFETGAEREVDLILVASAPETVQKSRVLARPGMTPERLDAIMSKQTPDSEKRRRAHAVIDTGRGFDAARRQVVNLLRACARLNGSNENAGTDPRYGNDRP